MCGGGGGMRCRRCWRAVAVAAVVVVVAAVVCGGGECVWVCGCAMRIWPALFIITDAHRALRKALTR